MTAETLIGAGERMFYVCSVKWSEGRRDCVVWWRPNDEGYTQFLDCAGKYTEAHIAADPKRYNNGDTTAAIPCDVADRLARPAVYIDHKGVMLATRAKITPAAQLKAEEAWRERVLQSDRERELREEAARNAEDEEAENDDG